MNTTTYFVGKYKVEGVENYASIDDCYEFIKNKKLLGLDIETTRKFQNRKEFKGDVYRGGLDAHLTNVVMLQIGNLHKIYVIDVRDFSKKELKPILDFLHWNKKCTFIGVNLKFEGKHLRHNYGIRLKKVWDCMIAEMCLYNGLQRGFSLAGMAYNYLDVKKVEDINLFEMEKELTLNDEFVAQNDFLLTAFEIANEQQLDKSTRMEFVTIGLKPFTAKQILYGSDDILYPILIMERQLLGRKLSNGEVYLPHKLFRMENSFTQAIADMELNGMPFDEEVWLNIATEQEGLYKERLEILNNYVKQFYPKFVEEPNLFDFEQRCKIEWGSSTQTVEFFRYLDICPKEFSKQTKKMDFTVGATALLKTLSNEYKTAYMEQTWIGFETDEQGNYIEDNQKLILAYLLFKRSEQNVSTFGRNWLKYVHPITKRVHTNFRQILNSGRMASSAPNCFTLDTELLTPNGWKKYDEINIGDEIFSFNIEKNCIEEDIVNSHFIGEGDCLKAVSRNYSLGTTKNHRILTQKASGIFETLTQETLTTSPERKILGASAFNNIKKNNVNEEFLILLCATQGDGYIKKGNHYEFADKKKKVLRVVYEFTKERKYIRLKETLNKISKSGIIKIDDKGFKTKGTFSIIVTFEPDYFKPYLTENKTFSKSLIMLDYQQREFILNEIMHWDGLFTRFNSYISKEEENVDILLALCTLTNVRGYKRIYKLKDNPTLYFILDLNRRIQHTWTNNLKMEELGVVPVWCVKTSNDTVIARSYLGTPTIIHQCQQIPGGRHRDAFKVADENNTLIFADFSNQEVRTVACLAEEEVMLDFFINGHPVYGDDNHMYTANQMNRAHNPNAEDFPAKGQEGFTKFHGKKRGEAKIISFGLLYGKEAKGFAEDFGLTPDEAQVFIDNYFAAYPKLKESMDKWVAHTMKNNYIQIDQTVDRRWFSEDFSIMEETNEEVKQYYPEAYFKRGEMTKEEKADLKEELNMEYPQIKELWRKYFGIRGSLQRKSTNYRIQGTSSSETKTALILMRNELIEKGIEDVLIIVAVHDEIGLEVLNEETVPFAKEFIERNMMDGANIFLNPPIMKATAEVGKMWIH